MANYIHQEILCEAYTHFKVEEYPSEESLSKLKAELVSFFEERAIFLFGNDIKVVVEFEKGSLKTKLKVLGGSLIISIPSLIANYGSIRQGVDTIVKDSTVLAHSGVLEIAFRTKTAFCDNIAIEKRKGVFGRTSELMTELDTIREILNSPTLPENSQQLKQFNQALGSLISWDSKVDKLMAKLENDSTKACISAGLSEELEKLQDEPPWADSLTSNTFRVKVLKSDIDKYQKINSASQSMQNTVAAVKKKMEQRTNHFTPLKS